LLIVYYKGLKNLVKDKFSRINKSDNLSEIIIKVCKIDNCFYFKSQKRKDRYSIYRRIDIVKNPKSSNWLDFIELDITTKCLIL